MSETRDGDSARTRVDLRSMGGPLRNYIVVDDGELLSFVHRRSGEELRVNAQQVFTAWQRDPSHPIDELVATFLPPLCDDCGRRLADTDRVLCRSCVEAAVSALSYLDTSP